MDINRNFGEKELEEINNELIEQIELSKKGSIHLKKEIRRLKQELVDLGDRRYYGMTKNEIRKAKLKTMWLEQ